MPVYTLRMEFSSSVTKDKFIIKNDFDSRVKEEIVRGVKTILSNPPLYLGCSPELCLENWSVIETIENDITSEVKESLLKMEIPPDKKRGKK